MIAPLHTACAAAVLLALAMPAVQAAQNNPHQPAASATAQGKYIERGRYLVKVGGCNDCHTAGYGMSAGKVPEKDWLQGDQLGWRGPWGTTYPTNLRLSMNALGEDDWIRMAQTMQARPPMPWFTLHQICPHREIGFRKQESIFEILRHRNKGAGGYPTKVGSQVARQADSKGDLFR